MGYDPSTLVQSTRPLSQRQGYADIPLRRTVWVDADAEPFCPMVRYTASWGPIVVNASMSNRQRLELLGRALYGRRWRAHVARDLEVSRTLVNQWTGTHTRATNKEPPDDAISGLIEIMRRQSDRLLFAVEEARLPPWID